MRGAFLCTVCGRNEADDPAARPICCGVCGPPPVLSAADFGILEVLARTRLKPGTAGREALLQKLDRAVVLPRGEMPADVVRLRTQLLFALDGDSDGARNLLVPAGPAGSDGLPVVSGLGLVLLGLREGAETAFADGHDRLRRATVLRVLRHLDTADDRVGGRAAVIPFDPRRAAAPHTPWTRPPRGPDGAA